MKSTPETGKLIVFDGNDGSGKNTQAQRLRTELVRRGKGVMLIDFPGYNRTIFGRLLEEARMGKLGDFSKTDPYLASLPYALDRWASKKQIARALGRGEYVVCDRYTSANQIHQGGKIQDEGARIAFLEWIEKVEYEVLGIPIPDISIHLEVSVELSESNMSDKPRDELEKNLDYLRNSHKTARWLTTQRPDSWITIRCGDGFGEMRSREVIHQDVVRALEEKGVL